MKYRSWPQWKKYSRIKVSHIPTCSATDMTVMTLEKNVGPQVAFCLIYLHLLFLIQFMKISLCFVHILTFLPGRNIFFLPHNLERSHSSIKHHLTFYLLYEVVPKFSWAGVEVPSTLGSPEPHACLCGRWYLIIVYNI